MQKKGSAISITWVSQEGISKDAESGYIGILFLTPMMKKPYVEIHMVFDHDDEKPYDFIWLLAMMMKNNMNSCGF